MRDINTSLASHSRIKKKDYKTINLFGVLCGEQEPDNEMWVKFYLAQPYLDFHTICLKFAPGAEEKSQCYQLYLFGFF